MTRSGGAAMAELERRAKEALDAGFELTYSLVDRF
jgi:hypothetical protein